MTTELEYSDVQSYLMTEEGREDMLLLAYDKFREHYDRLTEWEKDEYRSAISLDEKIKWAA